jgi:hypothetical protein
MIDAAGVACVQGRGYLIKLMANGTLWLLVLIAFLASIIIAAVFLIQLPATYFLNSGCPSQPPGRSAIRSWSILVVKNLLGAVLVALGVVMLLTPGQGILTILIGIILLDFPGKRRLERKLIARPGVLDSINRLRAHFGKAPFVIEKGKRP